MRHLFAFLTLASVVLVSSLHTAAPRAAAQAPSNLYLPSILYRSPTLAPFGVQTHTNGNDALLEQAQQLGLGGIRYGFLNWRAVQPTPDASYNWAAVAEFENVVRKTRQNGIEPLIFVGMSPSWAVVPRSDGRLSACAAIRDEALDEFAAFMAAAAARYAQPEFGVRYWELGNEVDVDPMLVQIDNGFGCWGDINDPFYGGERYGRMLKLVTPAIKAANPQAQVVFGGLLLDNPNTQDGSNGQKKGKPEKFLEGALRGAGGAPFDILAYHSYPAYLDRAVVGQVDFDTANPGNPWRPLGGSVIGKANYLREVMARYGVSRPLWLNETSLMCPNDTPAGQYPHCKPPSTEFFQDQATYLARTIPRALANGIEHVDWYALETVWRYTGLLDEQIQPKVVHSAYRQLITRLGEALPLGQANYGPNIEGYRFRNGSTEVHVVWAIKSGAAQTVTLPAGTQVAAYSRDGATLPTLPVPGVVSFAVGFEPIYLVFD